MLATALLLLGLLLPGAGVAADPPIPTPQGFVTDLAGVVAPPVRQKIERLAEELRSKTGAEIAVLTVRTTQPLDDFTYAMRVADAWKPGKRGDDTGVLVLLAVDDRKSRILVGYGLEGILPDGVVGRIQDEQMIPAFRAGKLDEGLWRGVAAVAARIAADRGITLDGVPAAVARPSGGRLPAWALLLLVLLLCVVAFGLLGLSGAQPTRGQRRRHDGWGGWGGGGGFPGGFGGGGGGFGGFGGGSFGGGGAGRSW